VSDAERELSRRSTSAQEFADDDLELAARTGVSVGRHAGGGDGGGAIDQRIASWRAVARYPDLVGTIYLASAVGWSGASSL
jgi:hypothetical protein